MLYIFYNKTIYYRAPATHRVGSYRLTWSEETIHLHNSEQERP